ncbi:hypothetical protein M1271_05705 [Patescibacteria group bacterium]|nr:hypothetical protein [Patescibacteria group bacterium]
MDNEDKKTIELFLTKIEELLSCSLLKSKHQISFKLNITGNTGLATTTTPDEEQLRSFLLVFRNFYSPREKINFPKISEILERYITNTQIKDNIRKTREVYQNTLDRSPMSLIENEIAVPPKEILRRWMYGFYHHTDEEKRQKIEAWGFAVGLTKTQFISTLFDLTRCIVWLGNVAKQYIEGKIT